MNDYEGIGGYKEFRSDLALMYFVYVSPVTGKLIELRMIPTQAHRFRVQRAGAAGAQWLEGLLNREGQRLRTRVTRGANHELVLRQA